MNIPNLAHNIGLDNNSFFSLTWMYVIFVFITLIVYNSKSFGISKDVQDHKITLEDLNDKIDQIEHNQTEFYGRHGELMSNINNQLSSLNFYLYSHNPSQVDSTQGQEPQDPSE